jgi:hypothetical protein
MSLLSFGEVLVWSPTTLVQLTSAYETAGSQPGARIGLKSVTVQARPLNVGIVYVGLKGFSRGGTCSGLLIRLPKPVSALTGPFTAQTFTQEDVPSGFSLNDLWVDADNAGDGVLVSGVQG